MSAKLKDLHVEERICVVEDLWDSIAADQESVASDRCTKVGA